MKVRMMLFSIALCSSPFVSTAYADSQLVGRYTTQQIGPLTAQQDLLQQTFQITFPDSVNTVGDAINYLLRFSGYTLAKPSDIEAVVKDMLKTTLPESDRVFGPMTLQQGLQTLVGSEYQLIVDPVNRSINFRLLYQYQPILKR